MGFTVFIGQLLGLIASSDSCRTGCWATVSTSPNFINEGHIPEMVTTAILFQRHAQFFARPSRLLIRSLMPIDLYAFTY
ncbi:hypothetical protein BGZ61DRAFT_457079 [Ilyonectria robusta]|uniref:uncharacterized protein n=1 Tax=Ilyonectria robusta TaxID=1079257 RepID=UPI001E8E6F41|nr:uncharacterized protein BGZ61DRAFT_457079 [Ilyonectria robusta]KAH8679353.1 hypothetical protein BGZ61DRAFT_457079 [Ilyonectria robusta]